MNGEIEEVSTCRAVNFLTNCPDKSSVKFEAIGYIFVKYLFWKLADNPKAAL